MANQDPNGFLLDDIVLSENDLKGGITEQQRDDIRKTKLKPGQLLSDPAVDNLMNVGPVLEITHVPSGTSLTFAAFITAFDDKFSSSWSTVDAYGRMDTMPVYQNTRRAMTVGWDVPSYSLAEAKKNFSKLSILEKFLYPEYETGDLGASTIKSAPLLRMKFGNFMVNAETGQGLLGYVGGFSFTPDLEAGFHMEGAKMYPKVYSLSADFTVLHEHNLGWDKNKKFRGGKTGYPYGVQDSSNTSRGEQTQEKNQSAPSQVQEARNKATLGSGRS